MARHSYGISDHILNKTLKARIPFYSAVCCMFFIGFDRYCYRSLCFIYILFCSYLPTPLLGQDMTQGQFLSGV